MQILCSQKRLVLQRKRGDKQRCSLYSSSKGRRRKKADPSKEGREPYLGRKSGENSKEKKRYLMGLLNDRWAMGFFIFFL